MELIPANMTKEVLGGELTIDDKKSKELMAKAKELLTEPMEAKDLMDKLEQYYVFEKGEHYTSAQLGSVVEALYLELNPLPEPVIEEPVIEEPKIEEEIIKE